MIKRLLIIAVLYLAGINHYSYCQTRSSNFLNKTNWFTKAHYGVIVHFLYQLQNEKAPWNLNKITSWDSCVNDFDVKLFAEEIKQAGADYVIFTVQQRSKYMCIPNKTFEQYTGYKRGTATASRDLISDLYDELKKSNIKLFLYITGDGPYGDSTLRVNFKYGFTPRGTLRISETFLDKWCDVIREISMSYRNKISGWWIDGCYPWTGYTNPELKKIKMAACAGNKTALVAFNAYPDENPYKDSTIGNYTAGEEYNLKYFPSPDSVCLNNKYWHAATYIGKSWTSEGVRFSDQYLVRYLDSCHKNKGPVTLGIAIDRNGKIKEEQLNQLKRINKLLEK